MNLPNKLTLLRVILVPFFVVFLTVNLFSFKIQSAIALGIFILASITDFLDGYIARKQNLITTFGKFLDPLADKILVVSALVCFIIPGLAHPIAVIIIIVREFMVSGLRLVTADKGVVVSAGIWGKIKTAFTMAAEIIILVLMIAGYSSTGGYSAPIIIISQILVWICAALTVISGLIYVHGYKDYLLEEM
jgi:CDP-diacylglycerol--glycerol-3-phosphate 3-phosphatidyltransferase